MNRGTVTIKTKDGERTIPASLFGDHIAVHFMPTTDGDLNRERLTVTHIPTGMAILLSAPAKEAAKLSAFAAALATNDWDFTVRDGAKSRKEAVLSAAKSVGLYLEVGPEGCLRITGDQA